MEEQLNMDFAGAVISGPRKKGGIEKQRIRPLLKKGELCFQIETFRNHQAFHQNLSKEETILAILEGMREMKQMQIETRQWRTTVLAGKKGTLTIKKKAAQSKTEITREHNRKKRYILEEGVAVPFLLDLGVLTKEGRIVRSRMDKFRQINRYLEFVEDVLPALDKEREADVILAVPCCQHELNRQIRNETLAPVLKYGLIKERIAALVTDALRAEHLEACGYEAQILEFIEMEHTPKNILIRAVRTGHTKKDQKALENCEAALHVTPSIAGLLKERQRML